MLEKLDYNHAEHQLHLCLTGPGGTGKTHVVKSVQTLMKEYGCEHQICFLAPAGTAASLINGITCHKGLKLGIKLKKQGSMGFERGDYEISISTQ